MSSFLSLSLEHILGSAWPYLFHLMAYVYKADLKLLGQGSIHKALSSLVAHMHHLRMEYILPMAHTMIALSTRMVGGQYTTENQVTG